MWVVAFRKRLSIIVKKGTECTSNDGKKQSNLAENDLLTEIGKLLLMQVMKIWNFLISIFQERYHMLPGEYRKSR